MRGLGPAGSHWETDTYEDVDGSQWYRAVLTTLEGWTLCEYATRAEDAVAGAVLRYKRRAISPMERAGYLSEWYAHSAE